MAGLFDRYYRTWDGNLFAQDNIKITPKFTFNLGLRYERLGDLSDNLGRNSSFDPLQADHTGAGSQAGYIVASNFRGAALPQELCVRPTKPQPEASDKIPGDHALVSPGSCRITITSSYGAVMGSTTRAPRGNRFFRS